MKIFKRLFRYFFPRKVAFYAKEDPIFLDRERSQKDEEKEVKFFEPVTHQEHFEKSKTLADFMKKIDNK